MKSSAGNGDKKRKELSPFKTPMKINRQMSSQRRSSIVQSGQVSSRGKQFKQYRNYEGGDC